MHQEVSLNEPRSLFEKRILESAFERDIPILGICGGEQLINVVLGGTTVQHIPETFSQALDHDQKPLRHLPCHDIDIKPGTLLHQWFGETKTKVNTSHHQAVNALGQNVVVNAIAPDGVIEGIEVPHKRFCVGVQWHPEFLVSPLDHVLFSRFIQAACDSK